VDNHAPRVARSVTVGPTGAAWASKRNNPGELRGIRPNSTAGGGNTARETGCPMRLSRLVYGSAERGAMEFDPRSGRYKPSKCLRNAVQAAPKPRCSMIRDCFRDRGLTNAEADHRLEHDCGGTNTNPAKTCQPLWQAASTSSRDPREKRYFSFLWKVGVTPGRTSDWTKIPGVHLRPFIQETVTRKNLADPRLPPGPEPPARS